MKLILRKSWHVLGAAFPALYYFGATSQSFTLALVGGIILVAVALEVLRFTSGRAARAFAAVFGPLMRDAEHRRLNATIPFLVSTFLTILIFPQAIACVSLFFLACGDVAGAVIGGALGRVRLIAGKTLEGTLACFGVCVAVGLLFLDWRLALAGAGAAAAAELLSGGWVDNFSMPVAAGVVMWSLSHVAGINLPA
jgi:glycerol-3-phosphate acyltransferase PlsY